MTVPEEVATLAELSNKTVGEATIGRRVWVQDQYAFYEAVHRGHGLECWKLVETGIAESGEIRVVRRTVLFDDNDIDVGSATATIPLLDVDDFPDGVVVFGLAANVTDEFGGGGVTAVDVVLGSTALGDLSAAALDLAVEGPQRIDALTAVASGSVSAVLTANANLGLTTSGRAIVDLVYALPADITILQPPGES